MSCNLLLTLLLITVTADRLSAQVYPGSRRVSCREENISVEGFFRIVYEQTGMTAFYNDEQLSSLERISVSFRNEPLDNVLAAMLRKRSMVWCYRKDVFVIAYRRPGDVDLGMLPGEGPRTITGLIVNEKGRPLEAAVVRVADQSKGVATDKDGRFTLRDVDKDVTLLVSRTGYKPTVLSSYADSVYVQLIAMVAPLQEVKVNGIKQIVLTGSVSGLKGKEITYQPVSNVMGVLQGQIPGLYVHQTTGLPGGGYRIRLRGKNSIESACDPLILVDGIPIPSVSFKEDYINTIGNSAPLGANVAASPLNLLSINDIASVEILKDADATAVYGTRGANGVILINSKTPKAGEKDLNVNIYRGVGKVAHFARYLDTKQYMQMRYEGIKNDGGQLLGTENYDLGWGTTRYTDWQKKMIGGTANITDASLEWKNGNTNAYYRISGLYRLESTVYPSNNFRYKKGGVMGQANFNSRDQKLKSAVSLHYVWDNNLLPETDLTAFSSLPPNTPDVYTLEKKLNFINFPFGNPYANLLRTFDATSQNFRANVNATYEPVRNLVFGINAGYSSIKVDEVQVNPGKSFSSDGSVQGFSNFFDNKYRNGLLNLQAAWKKTFGKEQLTLLAGVRLQNDDQRTKSQQATGYKNDALLEWIEPAEAVNLLGSVDTHYLYRSFYSRIEYKHADKYILTLTGNRDASYRLSASGRYGTFGTVGAAWIFTRENWLKNSRVLSFGKLRGSYGLTGNDQYMRYKGRGTYVDRSGSVAPPDYRPVHTWEKIRKAEIAVDLGFLHDRLLTTFCYYNNKSKDQLLTGRYETSGGYAFLPVNHRAVVENTGFEMDLEALVIRNDKLTWNTTFNISFPKNRLTAFPDMDRSNYQTYYNVGMSLDMVQGYRLLGVNTKTGVYEFEDGENNELSGEDRIYGKELGPVFYGGMQQNFRYKDFELNLLFRFAKQNNYAFLYSGFGNPAPGSIGNQPLSVLDNQWQKPGDRAVLQQFTSSYETSAGKAFSNVTDSDQRITDVRFFRLQSLNFGYYFSQRLLNNIKIKSCKLYVQGLNLFTLTNYKGLDPELNNATQVYPSLRVFTIGMQASF